jgi:DNA-binding HxlR family transcriptional regulator
MPTQTLRDLERHGIVERIDYTEVPPRVGYKLARLGRSLSAWVLRIEEGVAGYYSCMTGGTAARRRTA